MLHGQHTITGPKHPALSSVCIQSLERERERESATQAHTSFATLPVRPGSGTAWAGICIMSSGAQAAERR